MKNIVVLYHKNCQDGFGAAWAAWKKLGHKADYIAVQHQQSPPEHLTGKRIYLLDFCYSLEVTEQLIKKNKRVTAIDHHGTAEAAVQLTADYRYDPTHSGAVLAWQYFHPQKPVPRLIQYIEDGDLWRFKLPQTKEARAFLELHQFDFNKWNTFARAFERTRLSRKHLAAGAVVIRYEDLAAGRLVKENAEKVFFADRETLAVNSPILESIIGHALVQSLPPIGIVWRVKQRKIVVSLRSDGSVDVAEIAKKFGGGGHPTAAGFTIDAGQPFPWTAVK